MFKKELNCLSFTLFGFVILSLCGAIVPALDILAHFRLHYVASAVFFIIVAYYQKNKKTLRLNVITLTINIVMVIWALSLVVFLNGDGVLKQKIYAANVLSMNTNYQEITKLSESDYDVILLLEINHDWRREIKALKESHPYFIEQPRADNFGLAFYSKKPFVAEEKEFHSQLILGLTVPYIWAEFEAFIFVGLHTLNPLSRSSEVRNEQMQEIAKTIQSMPDKQFIVMGDFNDTIWSANFQSFIKTSGLKPAATGVRPTWPIFASIAGIQVDHALVKGFSNVRFDIKSPIGSDHRPITLEIYDE